MSDKAQEEPISKDDTVIIAKQKPSGDPKVKPKKQPSFKIENLDDLYNVMTIAKGGNHKAQQTLNNFLNFRDIIERSNFPDRNMVKMSAFLKMASVICYKDREGNPFRVGYESVSSSFMAYKSKKSDQFVEMTKQTPSISELTTESDKKPGIRERLFGKRGDSE